MLKRTITLERALFIISTINTRVVDPRSIRIGIGRKDVAMKLGSIEYRVTDENRSATEIASAIENALRSETASKFL